MDGKLTFLFVHLVPREQVPLNMKWAMIIIAILSSIWGGGGFGGSTFIAFSESSQGTFTNHIPQNVSPVEFSIAWCDPLEAKCDAVAIYDI